MNRFWICYRQQDGQRCLTRNPMVKQKCVLCGGLRPAARRPKHMVALETEYETYVALNGGEVCGVCGRRRTGKDRRLDRDHDHRTGQPRGLLCHKCNRLLASWVTPELLDAAAAYLRRTAA
jgi:Recombination endonuclease VII